MNSKDSTKLLLKCTEKTISEEEVEELLWNEMGGKTKLSES